MLLLARHHLSPEPHMPDFDQTALAEMTTEMVAAYVTKNSVRPADMSALISIVHGTLASLGQGPAPEIAAQALKPAVPIKKSITDGYLVCLDDGKHFTSLKRHLTKLGMTPTDYRAKWGLADDYPMVAPAYAAKRSALAKSMGLGSQRRKG